MQWRYLGFHVYPGHYNMALDEAMMQCAKISRIPIVRFYQWTKPTLSIGYFQKAAEQVNHKACKQLGVDWIRRPTGGRGVLHQHEITYSIAMPLDYPKLPNGVTQSYRWLSQGLAEGLRLYGVNASLSESITGQGRGMTAACFDSPSWYELVVDDKKLVGSAQTRKDDVLLQHGSILIDFDLDLFLQVLNFPTPKHQELTKKLLLNKSTTLQAVLQCPVNRGQLVKCLEQGLAQQFSIELVTSGLTSEELALVSELSSGKYQTAEWNTKASLPS